MMLQVQDLRRSFGGIAAVAGVSLEIAHGEILCVIGPNGAGKSSLLNLLCGTVRADSGRIAFEGRDLSRAPMHRFARSGIVRKFQAPSLFEELAAAENLRIAGEAAGHAGDIIQVDEVLGAVSLRADADTKAAELAHGKRQWLEIGMCLMLRPKLLLLDEPTAGMTAEETLRTVELLRTFASDLAVVVVEHDMAFVRALGTRTCVMHQGQLVRDGEFAEIERDEFVKRIYLGS